jgi:hypothetical protein
MPVASGILGGENFDAQAGALQAMLYLSTYFNGYKINAAGEIPTGQRGYAIKTAKSVFTFPLAGLVSKMLTYA